MQYFDIYKDVWDWHKKYSVVSGTDSYWNNCLSEARAISRRYGQCPFVRELLLAVINELKRIAKEARKNAKI